MALMKGVGATTGNEVYKDRLFTFIFGNEAYKAWTLELYNAINHTQYDNPEDISIETLRQVLYMGMHDDVAFVIADMLNLWEQQSTFNPNMPLRMLEYTANLFEKYIKREGLNKYSQRQIMLPTPRLIVFYNGLREAADESVLRLSDAFKPEHRDCADIAVNVRMININQGHSQTLMEDCRPLSEYAWIVDSIRTLRRSVSLEAAIDQTIDGMAGDFMTRPVLQAHKAEVKNMLLTEYNEVETMELFKKEWRAEGREEGRDSERVRSIRQLMQSLKLTARQAMDALGIPAGEQSKYEALMD